MKDILIGVLFIGLLMATRRFPNVGMLVISALAATMTFLVFKLTKDDDRLIRHVEKAPILRLLLILAPGLAFGCILTGLTLFGVYMHLSGASLFDSTEIGRHGNSRLRRHFFRGKMLAGTYSNAVLLIGISCFCAFFSSITFFVLRSTVTGLMYRFGLIKRGQSK